jgi:hypothetical protein
VGLTSSVLTKLSILIAFSWRTMLSLGIPRVYGEDRSPLEGGKLRDPSPFGLSHIHFTVLPIDDLLHSVSFRAQHSQDIEKIIASIFLSLSVPN